MRALTLLSFRGAHAELSAQSEELAAMVATFRLAGHGRAGPPPDAPAEAAPAALAAGQAPFLATNAGVEAIRRAQ